jgi:hypothetical protein
MVLMSGTAGGPDGTTSTPWPNTTLPSLLSIAPGDVPAFLTWFFPLGAADPAACRLLAAHVSWQPYSKGAFNQTWVREQGLAINGLYKDPSTAAALGSEAQRLIVLHGIMDKIVPIRNAIELGALWHGAWVLQLQNQGHGLPFSALDQLLL